jgi:hypothetical protein
MWFARYIVRSECTLLMIHRARCICVGIPNMVRNACGRAFSVVVYLFHLFTVEVIGFSTGCLHYVRLDCTMSEYMALRFCVGYPPEAITLGAYLAQVRTSGYTHMSII